MPVEFGGKQYLKTSEAAKRAGVDVQTIRRWLKEGLIQGRQTQTNRWLVEEKSLERHLGGDSRRR